MSAGAFAKSSRTWNRRVGDNRSSPTGSRNAGTSARRPAPGGTATKPVAARRYQTPKRRNSPKKAQRAAGITRRSIGAEEIVERTLYSLVNEGALILEEGFALRASDIDIMYVYGYGFPPARGGPMWYADTVGLKTIYDRICQFEQQHGEVWKPAPLLKRLADAGKSFADYDKEKAANP